VKNNQVNKFRNTGFYKNAAIIDESVVSAMADYISQDEVRKLYEREKAY